MKWTWNKKKYSDLEWGTEYEAPIEVDLPSEITNEVVLDALNKLGLYDGGLMKITIKKNMISVYNEVITDYDNSDWNYLGYFKAC